MQKDRILPDQIPLRDPYRCHKSKSYDKIKFTLEHFFFFEGGMQPSFKYYASPKVYDGNQ